MGTGTQDTFRETSGVLASRPTAAAYGTGWYFATDVNGGTVYHSDGSTWTAWAPGVTQPAGTVLGFNTPSTTDITTASLTAFTAVSITGVTTGSITTSGTVTVQLEVPQISSNTASTTAVLFIQMDGTNVRQSPALVLASTSTIYSGWILQLVHTPTAGSHTYTGAVMVFSTGPTVTFSANSGASAPQISVRTS